MAGYNRIEAEKIKKLHIELNDRIEKKISEFKKISPQNKRRFVSEMIFCFLTPQSKAKICWKCVETLIKKDIENINENELSLLLKGVRFNRKKSRYILEALKKVRNEKMIKKIIDPSKIDYIVSNHVEMDHSGSIPEISQIAVNSEIITSPNGEKGLKKHFGDKLKYRIVKTGEILNIGKRNLKFITTPMVHWPDNMVTLSLEDKILFSNDSFGQHIASDERFDDEYKYDIIMYEAKKYYANIVMPYGEQVKREFESLKDESIEMIAPSHGLIWRKNISSILKEYKKWADYEAEEKAVIVYDTMWDSTKKIAFAIKSAFEEMKIPCKLMDLKTNHISDIITDVLTCRYLCVGSPTLNKNILPTVSSFITYMKGLAPKNKKGIIFCSYGWGGESLKILENEFSLMNIELLDSFSVQYVPDQEALKNIKESVKNKIK